MKKDSVPRVFGKRIAPVAVLVSLLLSSVAAQALVGAGSQISNRSETGMIVPDCRKLSCDVADWDGDGDVDIYDFYAYVAAFAEGDPRADLNCDGTLDIDDYFLFLDLFARCGP